MFRAIFSTLLLLLSSWSTAQDTALLRFVVTGLPAGLEAKILLSGPPSRPVAIPRSGNVRLLPPGEYLLEISPVQDQTRTLVAQPNQRRFSLKAGDDQTIEVAYFWPASLSLGVTGLPQEGRARVQLRGTTPQPAEAEVPGQLSGLPPGRYELVPQSVVVSGIQYLPERKSIEVKLEGGQNYPVELRYLPAPGRLKVEVAGLPAGVAAPLTLIRSDGYTSKLTATTTATFLELPPGNYTLEAALLPSFLDPQPGSQKVQIASGQESTLRISYLPSTAQLVVRPQGLPQGLATQLALTGPSGTRRLSPIAAQTFDLPPGEYRLEAPILYFRNGAYGTTPASQTITLAPRAQVRLDLNYLALPMASLRLELKGMDSAATVPAKLTGPTGLPLALALEPSQTLNDLLPGLYTLEPDRDGQPGTEFDPQKLTLEAGKTLELALEGRPTPLSLVEGYATVRHANTVHAVALSPNGQRLMTGGADNMARLWDTAKGAAQGSLRHEHTVQSVAFSADASLMATGSHDGLARVWNTQTGQPLYAVRHQEAVWQVAFSPDGSRMATASYDKTVRLWNAQTGQAILILRHPEAVVGVAYSPDGQFLASGGADGILRVFEAKSGKTIFEQKVGSGILSLSFSPSGRLLAAGTIAGKIPVWDWNATRLAYTLTQGGSVYAVAFSPQGNLLVTGGSDNHARIWQASTGAPLATLPHPKAVSSLAFSSDTRLLATGCADDAARLWKLSFGTTNPPR